MQQCKMAGLVEELTLLEIGVTGVGRSEKNVAIFRYTPLREFAMLRPIVSTGDPVETSRVHSPCPIVNP